MLTELVDEGKAATHKIKHANVLLTVDADGPAWTDAQADASRPCSARPCRMLQTLRGEHENASAEIKENPHAPLSDAGSERI
jgi:hypothetical protein